MASAANPPGREVTATIGQVLDGRYRITAFIGDGGMGSVYRAEHVTIRKPVAVKLLHRDLASAPGFAERFEREAMTAGRIDHPNCVQVSDFGRLDSGTLYLVMELVEGQTLASVLADCGRLPIGRALHIAAHAARGLVHAHGAGIVHRDIKPDNIILVDRDGDPDFAKILDFGIAKMVGDAAEGEANPQLTQVGTTVGTPKFMPPEQAFGREVDGRSDLYSLTVVLFIMLTGRAPFEADEVIELLMKHASAPPPRLADVTGLAFPPALEAFISKGMAKKPADRFASATEFLATIEAIAASPGMVIGLGPGTGPIAGADGSSAFPAPGAGTNAAVPGVALAAPTPIPATGMYPAPAEGAGAAARGRLSRRQLGGLAATGAAVVLVVLFAARSGDGDQASAVEVIERGAAALMVKPSDLAQKAKKLNGEGRYQEVEELTRTGALDPHAALERGHALAGLGRTGEAVRAYLRAADDLSTVTHDPAILERARAVLGTRDVEADMAGFELLARHARDQAARAQLIEVASTEKRLERRRAARALADRLGIGGDVDLVASLSLDLAQGKNCEERREALLALGKLGDPKAVPAIKRARYRMRGGVLGIGDKNTNYCLKDDADRILAELGG